MYHIVFNADENYAKYAAVVIYSIIKHTNLTHTRERERESKPRELNLARISSPTQNAQSQNISQADFTPITYEQIKALARDIPNEPYHFHILSDGFSASTREKFAKFQQDLSQIYPCEISLHFLSDEAFRGTIKWGFEDEQNYLTYFRLLMARVLPENLDKCLYLDTDTLALCDVRELFMLDLKGKVLASNCADIHSFTMGDILEPTKCGEKAFEMSKVPYYICSALLLVNLHEWKAQNIEARCLEFLRNYKTHYADQDAINAVLDGRLLVLAPEYDLLLFQAGMKLKDESYPHKEELKAVLKHLKIGHFNGPAHPWLPKYRHLSDDFLPLDTPYRDKWWEIALQTPIFGDELREIKTRLDADEMILNSYIKALAMRLNEMKAEIHALKAARQNSQNFKAFIKHKILYNLIKKPIKSIKRKLKRL